MGRRGREKKNGFFLLRQRSNFQVVTFMSLNRGKKETLTFYLGTKEKS
jgi:hypothetical protein